MEWGSDSAEPSASIIQLALRGREEAVFILDVLRIHDNGALYDVLQALFRNRRTLKVWQAPPCCGAGCRHGCSAALR